MRPIHKIASFLIVILGLVHVGYTFFEYHGLSFEATWFFGSGLAIVLAGFINIAMLRDGGKDTVIWSMALVTNVVFLVLFIAAAYMMRQPQVFIGAVPFAITTAYSFVLNSKTS